MAATSQLVCVKRPEPSLSAVFEDMYLNERLVDVTISCPDGQLQAHKLVLAASSSYFSSLFEKLPNPFHYPVVFMKDMRIKDLKLIIDFIYRGQLTVTQERLTSLVRSAEGLQISGLTSVGDLVASNSAVLETNSSGNLRTTNQTKLRRGKKTMSTSSSNLNQHQAVFNRATYHSRQEQELDSRLTSPQTNKLMEQSMITGDSVDDSHPSNQFSYVTVNNDPLSTRNLTGQQQHQLNTPSPSIHVQQQQHLPLIDQHHQQQHFSSQLQVLSHSLAANRSSLVQGSTNGQQSNQLIQQQSRGGRVHPCNICWKTFREKANLKRHLQVHSIERTVYACPDCNKTFSWKDNYIRHTKTAHHINNVRPQT